MRLTKNNIHRLKLIHERLGILSTTTMDKPKLDKYIRDTFLKLGNLLKDIQGDNLESPRIDNQSNQTKLLEKILEKLETLEKGITNLEKLNKL